MSPSKETILDFDNTVGTEERFKVRRFLDDFVEKVNNANVQSFKEMISDAVSVDGFNDFTILKESFVGMLERKFSKGKLDYMRFPQLKLIFIKSLFKLTGTYEEFSDDILVTEGTIEFYLIKNNDSYQFVKIKFFPRMKLSDEIK